MNRKALFTATLVSCWAVVGTLGLRTSLSPLLADEHGEWADSQTASVAPPVAGATVQQSAERALIDRYCASCHSERLRTGGVVLESVDLRDVRPHAAVLEKVARKLRDGSMPPPGAPRPETAAATAVAASLEAALDASSAAEPRVGERIAFHRLNRAEYANAVRDLLAVNVDTRVLLPPDDSREGFDNMASVLTVSPMLLERYMSVARRVSRLAVGDPTIGPALVSKTYDLPTTLYQDGQMSEDLPFGSRGGAAIEHHFPLDGDYVVKVRLQRNYVDYVRGIERPHRLQVRLDGALVREFTVGGKNQEGRAPVSFAGNIPGTAEWEAYALAADEGLEVRLKARAGQRIVGVSFVRSTGEPEGIQQPSQAGYAFAVNQSSGSPEGRDEPAVDSVTIDGPYAVSGPGDTASRARIFVCRPKAVQDEQACATRILSRLARLAYRRRTTAADVETLVAFYRQGRRGADFESGVRYAIERLLVDPSFLFRTEKPPSTQSHGLHRISDIELASALSFFMWSSIPDDELLSLAERGRLRVPTVLEQQVQRMLRDPRAEALAENFFGQWLSQRALNGAVPNPDVFPQFDENLREAFGEETRRYVASHLKEDRGVLDLLTSRETFLNARLARHYGVPNVYGNHFRRVELDDPERSGLLGQGSILTVTSYGNRTSPVLRGHWVLENILGSPPPPPPPDVPGLAETGADGKAASVRERLELHRRSPACRSCHAQMDPLGFALEVFDATGARRQVGEGGSPVDATAVLTDGTKFEGPEGLRTYVLSRKPQVVETIVAKLLGYAMGRGVEFFDRPAVRAIVRDSASRDYRWSAIIAGIAQSMPFQMRSIEP